MATRVIISGGGTGGHIYPAIAIANALRELRPGTEVLFVGARGKMEMEKVPAAGYPVEGLDIAGFNRSNLLVNAGLPFKIWNSLQASRRLLSSFRPQVAVGVGGYASGPLLAAAGLRRLPYLIQEQNSYAGLTNRLLARRAARICVAYPGMEAFFPKEKLILTGNPVRSDIGQATPLDPQVWQYFSGLRPENPTLLVMGGSLGARTINESIAAGLEQLLAAGLQVIWQTGKEFEHQAGTLAQGHPGVWVSAFINAMPLAYAAADVVVSRAGALSISELCIAAKPAIFVPFPQAAEDHQTRNAQALVQRQAGLLVADADARQQLIGQVLALFRDAPRQQQMAERIGQLARPQAARQIAEAVLQLAHS